MYASRISGAAIVIAAFALFVTAAPSSADDGGILIVAAADGPMPNGPKHPDALSDVPKPPPKLATTPTAPKAPSTTDVGFTLIVTDTKTGAGRNRGTTMGTKQRAR